MKLVHEDGKLAIYDDVLSPEDFASVRELVRKESYTDMASKEWKRAWRLNDGSPMASRGYVCSERPFNNALDLVATAVLERGRAHPRIIGEEGERGTWDDLALQIFLYRRGTRISWHQDTRYAPETAPGSAVFYVHHEWSTTWGGELLVAHTRDGGGLGVDVGALIDGRDQRDLLDPGFGFYIVPKPNRLVLISGTVPHCTARVDDDAGEHVRCAFSAFFGRRGAFRDRK
jgi:hypothetical protein